MSDNLFQLRHLENLLSLRFSCSNGKTATSSEIGLRPVIYVLGKSTSPPNLYSIKVSIFFTLRDPLGKLLGPIEQELNEFDLAVSSFCMASLDEIVLSLHFDVLRSNFEVAHPRDIDPRRYNSIVRKQVIQSLQTLSEDSRFKLVVDTRFRAMEPRRGLVAEGM